MTERAEFGKYDLPAEFYDWWKRGCPTPIPARAQGGHFGSTGDKPGPRSDGEAVRMNNPTTTKEG
jgi:hypothetical protein